MALVRRNIHTLTEVTYYGADIEVPDDIIAKGPEAETAWMNENIRVVDSAKFITHESDAIRLVQSIWAD